MIDPHFCLIQMHVRNGKLFVNSLIYLLYLFADMMGGVDAGNRNSMATAVHQAAYVPDHSDGYGHHDGYGGGARPPPQPYMQDPYMQHSDP